MARLMIIVSSVRPGRVGLPVAEWARGQVEQSGEFEIDFVDLAELALPFMDEPNHPMQHQYTKPHTIAWSERVAAADAFLFVTPEYNHSYSPVLKNALDYLALEWYRKPLGIVSYGGVSSGTRGVASLSPVLMILGFIVAKGNVHLSFVKNQFEDGAFVGTESQNATLTHLLDELVAMLPASAILRSIR